MTVDPNERMASLEWRIRVLEDLIQGCRSDLRVLIVVLVVVFLLGSRMVHAILASLGFEMFKQML
jgi:hypothetical protein